MRVADFRRLWVGETVSVLGDQFYLVALPWLVLQLTGSALALGSVMMTAAVPRAALMLAGGVAADRFSPRGVMLASNVVRFATVASLAVLEATGWIRLWHLYVLSAVFGAFDAFFYPAYSSMLPSLVESDQLAAGNSWLQSSAQVTTLAGPAPAGLTIARFGTATALAVDAGTFLVSIAMLARIRPRGRLGGGAPATGLFTAIGDGMRYTLRDPVLTALIGNVAVINLSVAGPFAVGAPLLAKAHFGGAVAFGTMLSAFGLGALGGTAAAGALRRHPPLGYTLSGVALAAALGMGSLPFVPALWMAAAVLVVVGLVAGFSNVIMITSLHRRGDPAMMGRMMSLVAFSAYGVMPLSYLAAGAIAEVDLAALFLVSGLSVLVAVAVTVPRRALWQWR
jgi:predicted MFS family arabinose efflux permease